VPGLGRSGCHGDVGGNWRFGLTRKLRLTWKDVRDLMQGRILDSTYAPGDKLPKDEDIANDLGCARSTVQRAMRSLADSGLVERRRKGGTRVRIDPVTRATFDIPIARLEVEKTGAVYGYQLVSLTNAMTPLPVAANFGLSAPTRMLRIEALHLTNQRPYIYEDRWVSTQTVPEIIDVDLEKTSANEWLVRNRPYSRCDIRCYATQANETYARLLDTRHKEALLVVERTTWIGDAPITSVKAVAIPGYQLVTQA